MVKVKNIMTSNVVTIGQNANLVDAAKLLLSKSVRNLVITEDSKPIGIIGERDVIDGIMAKKAKVKNIMTKDFAVTSPNVNFFEIAKVFKEGKTRKFIVVDGQKLNGIVTEMDIINSMRDFTKFHQIMQEVILAIFGLATAFFLFYFSPLGASIFGRA